MENKLKTPSLSLAVLNTHSSLAVRYVFTLNIVDESKYSDRHDWLYISNASKLEFLKTSHRYHSINEALTFCHGTIKPL